jgi:L-amino acid N-acyltransferase YncA
MVLTIRPAQASDLPEAAALINEIIVKGGSTAIEVALTPDDVAEWFLTPGPRVHCGHVALCDGAVAGFQSVGRVARLPQGWGEMGTYTKLGSSQKGIGTALFNATKQAAKGLGLTYLNALIRSDNAGGLTYYTRMGFGDDRPAPDARLKSGAVIARVDKRFAL